MTPRSPRRWYRSLEAQLLVGFLCASLLPLILTAGLLTWRNLVLIEGFVSANVQQTAKSYATGLDLFVEQHRGRLRSLDLSGDVAAMFTAGVGADPSLEALWFANSAMRGAQAPAAWAEEACNALAAGPNGMMKHAAEPYAHEVVVAVRRGEDVLCGQVTFTLHSEMLVEQASRSFGGSVYIVDREGTVVCHAFEENAPHMARGATLSETVARIAGAGAPWAGTVGGEASRIAAFAPASELPWGVWVDVPAEVAVAPLRADLGRSLGYALSVAVFAVLAAMLLARRLGAPVREVSSAVRRVAGGQYGESVPVHGTEDVAELAQEFNRMSATLARSHAELEERVERRTVELRGARAFSDLLLDTIQQRILVINDQLKVVRANEAALRGYGRHVVGCGCTTIHGKVGEDCAAARVLASGERVTEERVAHREGRAEILAVELYPLLGEDGKPSAVVEIAQDVTELERIRAQLAHQEKMASLGTLAAGLAHEIGNPLASMSSELEVLESMWDPEEARAALPVLRDQIRRMSGLLRELVEFGRPAAEQVAPFVPADLLAEVARLLRHDPRSRGVELVLDAEASIHTLCTSRDRLVQVLVNLGLNALDAMEGEGRLRFGLSREGPDAVRFDVADTGPGVPDPMAAKVFDPFFTTKAPGRGTGLGLFISERIVQGLGGRLELESTAEGATFAVVLPWSPPELSEGAGDE